MAGVNDKDLWAAMQGADALLNLLRDYIPPYCTKRVREALIDTMLEQGLELTTTAMRKEYEAWKSTQINLLNLDPKGPQA